jgi:hypothetical protein
MSKSSAMSGRLVFVVAAGLAVSGCCIGTGCYVQPSVNALTSWDGLGSLPKRNHVKRVKVQKTSVAVASKAVASEDNSPTEEDLAKLRPYSKEWGEVFDSINRRYDVELRKKLIICRGCTAPESDDRTGSIAPKEAR